MERPSPSSLAWIGLAAGVGAYEATCPRGETLSEGVHRGLESKYRHLIQLGIGVTALHLARVLPPQVDPYHGLTVLKEAALERTHRG